MTPNRVWLGCWCAASGLHRGRQELLAERCRSLLENTSLQYLIRHTLRCLHLLMCLLASSVAALELFLLEADPQSLLHLQGLPCNVSRCHEMHIYTCLNFL